MIEQNEHKTEENKLTSRLASKELTIDEAIEIMQTFEFLGSAPNTIKSWRGAAQAFMKIVGTREKAYWFAEKIIDSCKRFPRPIEMRWIYSRFHTPADGIEPRDMDQNFWLKLPGAKNDDES